MDGIHCSRKGSELFLASERTVISNKISNHTLILGITNRSTFCIKIKCFPNLECNILLQLANELEGKSKQITNTKLFYIYTYIYPYIYSTQLEANKMCGGREAASFILTECPEYCSI